MSKSFRDYEKEDLNIRTPVDIALEFRLEATRQGRSVSDLGSELIIKYLGLKPSDYGISGKRKESVA